MGALSRLESPLVFLALLFGAQLLYLLPSAQGWLVLLGVQALLGVVALLVPTWRLYGFLVLGLLGWFNQSWLLAPTPKCSGPARIEARVQERPQGSRLKLLRPQLDCDGSRYDLAWAEVTWPQGERAGGWFLEGDRVALQGLQLQQTTAFGARLEGAQAPKVSNLSRLQAAQDRGYWLLYLQAKARYYLSGEVYGLLKALATADRSSLTTQQKRQFKELGIAHLLAISGMHTGILFLWLNLGLRFLLSLPHRLVEEGWSLPLADFGALGLLWGYLNLIGLPISAERAWMMLFWWALLKHFYHHQPLWLVLSGVGQWILLIEPWAIAQLSFQLSFLSVAGILLIAPFLPRPGRRLGFWRNLGVLATDSLMISSWLFLFNLVVLERILDLHSLLSPLNNLVHIFAVGWLVLPSYLLALGWSLLGAPFGGIWGEAWLYGWANLVSKAWLQVLEWNDQINQVFLFSVRLDWGPGARLGALALMAAAALGAGRFTRNNA